MILIKNGRIIDPKTKRDDVLDIVIDGGKILDIGKYGPGMMIMNILF